MTHSNSWLSNINILDITKGKKQVNIWNTPFIKMMQKRSKKPAGQSHYTTPFPATNSPFTTANTASLFNCRIFAHYYGIICVRRSTKMQQNPMRYPRKENETLNSKNFRVPAQHIPSSFPIDIKIKCWGQSSVLPVFSWIPFGLWNSLVWLVGLVED